MINQNQIQRLIDLRSYGRLIERLLPAARCRSRQAVEALCGPESAAPAAVGLALHRCCELSYLPGPLATRLAGQLATLRRRDGLFGEGGQPSIGASAVALRAMMDWRELCGHVGASGSPWSDQIDAALRALARLQDEDGLIGGDAVGSAIALSMLGDRADFRAAVDVGSLTHAVERSGAISVDLGRYACAMAA